MEQFAKLSSRKGWNGSNPLSSAKYENKFGFQDSTCPLQSFFLDLTGFKNLLGLIKKRISTPIRARGQSFRIFGLSK